MIEFIIIAYKNYTLNLKLIGCINLILKSESNIRFNIKLYESIKKV
jgi:hypothetical protein